MSNGEHRHKIGANVIADDVPAVAKVDNHLTKFRREIWYGPAYCRVSQQQPQLALYCIGRAFRGGWILGPQEFAHSHQSNAGVRRKNQSWHSGGPSSSSPLPHESSQANASEPVMCNPVS